MGVMTREQYIESLRKQKPNVIIDGKKVENVVDSTFFRTTINLLGLGYDFANDPEFEELVTAWSPLINEKVSFWTHIRQDRNDLLQTINAIRTFSGRYTCTFCIGLSPSIMWAVTQDLDELSGTDYHKRFTEFFKYVQRKDLRLSVGIMDPKGDRSLRPCDQPDPDLYLRVVEQRADGIVVNGAKLHITNMPCTHYVFVFPCIVLNEKEKDYAISFAIPIDTEGLTLITRPASSPLRPQDVGNPISSEIGFVESLCVFDNVFVPWEKVFMCGEWQATRSLISYFQSFLRFRKCACTSARIDILIGAAALIAEYNGVEKANHIRQKITDMMIASEIGWGCANGAIALSSDHRSGVAFPDSSISSAGLYHVRLCYPKFVATLQDIAGGLVTTMPIETDCYNPNTKPLIEKYLKGKANVPVENRIKLLNLIQDLTASRFSGWLMGSVTCAAGTPETNRIVVTQNYDLDKRKEIARRMAKIKI